MRFALDAMKFCRRLPDSLEGRHIRGQLFRAATSTAANYRAACRGKSKADFISKLGTALEEIDEAEFWLQFTGRAEILERGTELALQREAGELVAILSQSVKTAKGS
jgi:four helix bundle protein